MACVQANWGYLVPLRDTSKATFKSKAQSRGMWQKRKWAPRVQLWTKVLLVNTVPPTSAGLFKNNQQLHLSQCGRSSRTTHTHTHTTVLLLFWNMSGTTQVSRYQKGKTRKVKTNLDLLEQEVVSGSGICWAICKSAPQTRQRRQYPTTQFFTGRMPFLPPNQQHQSTEGMSKHLDKSIIKNMPSPHWLFTKLLLILEVHG